MSDETQAGTTPQPVEAQRLQFLMRSGNSFVVDGVEDWEMTHRDGHLVSLRLRQSLATGYTRLIVESIDLAQIEAVLILPPMENSLG